jgi:hypothetical protein
LGVLAACGGRVEVPPDDPDQGGVSNPAPGAGAAASGSGKGDGFGVPKQGLEECKPGFSASDSSRTCDWTIPRGLCYSSKEAACACACPRDRDSTCISDFFDGPGSATKVFCD